MQQENSASVTEKQTDVQKEKLLGPVKQIVQTCYKAHSRSDGIVRGKIEIGTAIYKTNFTILFDEKGGKIEEMEFETYQNKKTFFNEIGQEIKSIAFSTEGELRQTTTNTYDERGNQTERYTVNPDGTTYSRYVYRFNDSNKPIEELWYWDKEEKLNRRDVKTYSNNGDLLSIFRYKSDGSIEYRCEMTYNEAGKQIEDITEYTDESMSKYNKRITHRYNSHGDCIERAEYLLDGTLKDISQYTYQYDSEGKKIIPPRKPYDPFEKAPGETEELEYDTQGNWIKKTTFYKNTPVNVFIRQFVYYTDPVQHTLIHPLEENDNAAKVINKKIDTEPLSEEDAKWLAEAGTTLDNFPLLRYYTLKYQELPSLVSYTQSYIEVMMLLKELKENFQAQEIHSYATVSNVVYGSRLLRYTLIFPRNYGYMLHVPNISELDIDEFDLTQKMHHEIHEVVNVGQLQLLRPAETSERRDELFEDEIDEYISRCAISKKPDKPTINIIETSANNFVMREYPVDDNFEIRDLDINYGYGFKKFHLELMQRFNSGTKGLVLFHGEPGTGKTYYIRHLLRSMVANNKVVIYMPPNMVDHLVEPAFMTFLTGEVKSWSEDGYFCVLLIEDAEPLLAKRQEGVRIQGITNLLNMSDGLLNDMLNMQIICTFNVGLRKLDSALLRPGRLIARKEFKPLSELDANLLAQRLRIKHHFKGPATLGEIYAMRKNMNILIHDVESGDNASDLIDDLV